MAADIEVGAGGGSITLVAHSREACGARSDRRPRGPGAGDCPECCAGAGGGRLGIDCMQDRHRDGLRFAVESAARDGGTITLPPPADPEATRRA